MQEPIEIKIGTEIELLKPLEYYENIEEVIYTEALPVGRRGEYRGERRPRFINVHENIHSEYVNSDNMWFFPTLVGGGHVVSIPDSKGWGCLFTFSEEEFYEYIKVVDPQKVEVE